MKFTLVFTALIVAVTAIPLSAPAEKRAAQDSGDLQKRKEDRGLFAVDWKDKRQTR
ncbi:hypothetical protein MBM_02980 [Drepanopeziza brunnea f. sp. 'multigermtubi' MB_m1]|uniref:Uncharacterized protein n=1 Tax=Marssonina brunnea f. sp. multigermtubi (strain MB_m1) TaxID=1072389 RepID=K1XD51_MARBU|nr:uncharacterized protein MBM_02980 [Drepanopeziza brunnea f. sp. 'multigermtubi' MB_m1]EKD18738.1 hypothetical protein MBM_02980 [Drepanopeziza brunnea f. sp. 'multigermtubi' MB_m1]